MKWFKSPSAAEHIRDCIMFCLFGLIWVDPLRPGQHFFSHVRTGLPGLDQYYAADEVSYSRTQHSDPTGDEAQTSNILIPV